MLRLSEGTPSVFEGYEFWDIQRNAFGSDKSLQISWDKKALQPLGTFLVDFDTSGIQAIVPVPLSIGSLRSRGFNQSLLLAKTVSDSRDIPLIIDGLVKKAETLPQIGLSAKDRIKNLKGTFIATRRFTDKRVMLVDDVMTTGATANECSRQLIKAGASDVVVLTLARAAAL